MRATASYIGAGVIGGGGVVPAIPPKDWRMPASVAVSSGLASSASALTAAQSSISSKSRPSFVVPSGATEYVEWTVSEAGTLLLSWLGMSASTVTVSKNSIDLGFSPAFPSTSTVDGNNGVGGRRQVVKTVCVAGDVIRLTVAAGGADRTIEPLLHKKPDTGAWDAHLIMGASREDQGLGSKNTESAAIAQHPGSDPIALNYALSGAVASVIATLSETAGPLYDGIACYAIIPGNMGGNDVSNGRPYTSGQKAALDAAIATIAGNLSGYTIVMSNISYRAYGDVTPSVQSNGSLPYNDNVIHPAILQYAPAYYDTALQRGRIDEYLAILDARASLTDSTHGAGAAQRALWCSTYFSYIYSGSWSGITSQIEQRVALAESTATVKASALTNYNEASYAMLALSATPAKTAYEARMSAIYPTVLFYEAVRLIDAAVASSTQEDKDVAQDALDAADSAGYAGATPPNTIADQQARIDAIIVASFDQIIQIGHGAATAVTGWNRTASVATGVIVANLNNDAGSSTGVGLSVSNAPSGVSTNTGMVSAIPEIPSTILAATWTDINDAMGFSLTGLDPARTYDLVLMPCRQTAQASTTRYTVNGVVRTPDISPVNNVTTTLVVAGVSPDGSGNITINAARGAGSSYAYHTVTILKRHAA